MTTTYAGAAGNITAGAMSRHTVPQGTDAPTAAILNSPYQSLADWTEALYERVEAIVLSNWTLRTTGVAFQMNAVAWSQNLKLFAAAGASTTVIITSPDAITWTSRTSAVAQNMNAIFSPGGAVSLFVAVGQAGTGQTSTDGTTWTSRTMNAGTDNLLAVAGKPDGSLYCAVGAAGRTVTSPDGTTWTNRATLTGSLTAIVYNSTLALWVAVNSVGAVWTSTDPTVGWTARGTPITGGPLGLATGPGLGTATQVFIAVGASGIIYSSPDGITWTSRGGSTALDILAVCHNGRSFVGTGNGEVNTSVDGITWVKRPIIGQSAITWRAICSVPPATSGVTVFVGPSGTAYTSLNCPNV